jgi:hypothetical protein
MGYQIGLILLQTLGAIALVPYPAILVANVMQIAAERPPGTLRFVKDASPFALLSLYPLLWLVLDLHAWRAFGRGAVGRAFLLSAIPVALTLAAAGAWIASDRADRQREQARIHVREASHAK